MHDDHLVATQMRPDTLRFSRGVALVLRVALACCAAAWIILAAGDVALTRRAADWPTTAGVITWTGRTAGTTIINVSKTNPRPHSTEWIGAPDVHYRYVVGVDTLTGWRANVTQPRPDGFRVRPRAWFDQVQLPIENGADRSADGAGAVTVHYDPSDPRQSALNVDSSIATWVELILGISVLVALRPRRGRPSAAPPS